MTRRSQLLIIVVVLALCSVASGRAAPVATYTLQANSLSSGAGAAASASYAIVSTVGQPAVGQGSSASYTLCSGFWCQAEAAVAQLFLPLTWR